MHAGMSSRGRQIREIRKRLALTQGEFAQLLKTTQGTVSRWETDDQVPELQFLMRIAEAAGLDPIAFVVHDEEHPYSRSDWGKVVTVLGAIQWDHWSERIEWEQEDQFQVQIPTLPDWNSLEIFGFVVRDDSADQLYPKGSVVFASIEPIPGVSRLWDAPFPATRFPPEHGDIVVVRRRRGDGLIELTVRQFYNNAQGDTYLTSVAADPRFVSYQHLDENIEDPQIIGIVLASFRIEASEKRFVQK